MSISIIANGSLSSLKAVELQAADSGTIMRQGATGTMAGSVRIVPLNENQDLNYEESFKGTQKEILARALSIIKGLSLLFPEGSWSARIESFDLKAALHVDPENIYDCDFNRLRSVSEADETSLF